MSSAPLHVRCREIRDGDRDEIINILVKSGLSGPREFWVRGLQRFSVHSTPPGFPKYGFLLEINNVTVGTLLLISSAIAVNGEIRVRCNVSSWYVWPAFRSYASFLVSRALQYKDATYINISPQPHTLAILTAQGYTRYCDGRFIAIPALNAPSPKTRITPVTTNDISVDEDLRPAELDLLIHHAGYDCISVIVTVGDRRYPFVFETRAKFGYLGVPLAYLVYCRGIDDFVRVAGPLGRHLAKRGFPLVVLDANGPVPGLVGRYRETSPKYFKGKDRPRLGDLAYSERIILGVIT